MMLQLWRARPVLVFCFVLACAATLFFGVRFAAQAVYWSNPAHREQSVQGWMTVGMQRWFVPVDDAVAGLPLPQEKGHPQPLSEIAADRGVPVQTVIDAVERAIEQLRVQPPFQP